MSNINTTLIQVGYLNKVLFTQTETDFLKSNEACRLATCHNEVPHVVPVSYIFENGLFFIATDYETKKYKNLKRNRSVALVVDEYSSVGNKAICIQGAAEIIESGPEFSRLYKIFHDSFEWVRLDPWSAGEAPFVKIIPKNKASWGFR